MRLQNKVIIITGSTTGIGKSIAIQCAREGARVVVNGRNQEAGKAVVEAIGLKQAALYIEDIAIEGAAARLVQFTLEKYGKIDAIVNNAAMIVSSNIETTDGAYLRQVLEVNTVAPYLLIKEALSCLRQNKGSVVNIGSVNAYSGEANLMAYSISKGAMMTMTRNLGDSLFRTFGVRINQVNPGWVLTETEVLRKKEQGLTEDWHNTLSPVLAPSGSILMPEQIAACVIYLIADECGPVSGQVIDIEQYPFIGRNTSKDNATLVN